MHSWEIWPSHITDAVTARLLHSPRGRRRRGEREGGSGGEIKIKENQIYVSLHSLFSHTEHAHTAGPSGCHVTFNQGCSCVRACVCRRAPGSRLRGAPWGRCSVSETLMCWLVLQERTEREREKSVAEEGGRSVSKLFFVTGFFGITDIYELTSEQCKTAAPQQNTCKGTYIHCYMIWNKNDVIFISQKCLF